MVDDDIIAEGPDEEREALPTVGELQELVDEMVVALREARTVPLSSNVLVDREQFLANLERLRNDLPDEMRAMIPLARRHVNHARSLISALLVE